MVKKEFNKYRKKKVEKKTSIADWFNELQEFKMNGYSFCFGRGIVTRMLYQYHGEYSVYYLRVECLLLRVR